MKNARMVVFGLTLAAFLLPGEPASARRYIEGFLPLKEVIKQSTVIARGHIESVNTRTKTAVMKVTGTVKGKCPFTQIRMNIGVGQAWHPKALMPHLRIGTPALMFYNKGQQAECYMNGFFFQLFGSGARPPNRGWWNFTHIEVKMNRAYDGDVKTLTDIVQKALRGKARPPAGNLKKPMLTPAKIAALPKFGGGAPPRPSLPKGVLVRSFQDGVAPNGSYRGTRDAELSQNLPDANRGNAPTSNVDGDEPNGTGKDAAALLKWDLSAIPPGTKVRTVEIVLHVTDKSVNAYPLFALKRPWNERVATWKNRDGGAAWQTPGAAGAQDRGRNAVGSVRVTGPGTVTVRLNGAGVALVQSWVDRPGSNFGLILADANFTDGLDFAQREAPAAAQRPRLNVSYTNPKLSSSR